MSIIKIGIKKEK